jgi:tRNA threonylcarbamoyladenosine biosynthesis protein TsaE
MNDDTSLYTLNVPSIEQTRRIGRQLGKIARAGDIICLSGDLGAGKTTLTQAVAQGLEVPAEQYVTSPSFALLHEYSGRIPLYHMDCYRLSGEDDIEGAGLIDYIGAPGLTVIEWPDRLGSLRPDERLEIEITTAEQARTFCFFPHGVSWQDRLKQLLEDQGGIV